MYLDLPWIFEVKEDQPLQQADPKACLNVVWEYFRRLTVCVVLDGLLVLTLGLHSVCQSILQSVNLYQFSGLFS